MNPDADLSNPDSVEWVGGRLVPSASLTRSENAGHHKAGFGEGEALQISYLERFNLKQLICHLVEYD